MYFSVQDTVPDLSIGLSTRAIHRNVSTGTDMKHSTFCKPRAHLRSHKKHVLYINA